MTRGTNMEEVEGICEHLRRVVRPNHTPMPQLPEREIGGLELNQREPKSESTSEGIAERIPV